MPFDTIYLLYGAIFLGVLLLAEGVYFILLDHGAHNRANRRMNMLSTGMAPDKVLATLRRKPRAPVTAFGILNAPVAKLEKLMTQAGVTISVTRLLLIMIGVSVATFLILLMLIKNFELPTVFATTAASVILALVVGFLLPIIALQRIMKKRLKRFAEQLPDTLDVIVRSLQAGHPIGAAMDLVTKEMADPIGTEFGIAVDEMTYGLDIRDALKNLGDRVAVQDFQYVIVSINIQHDTGGNLAETLSNLSAVIRERFRMFKKIRALSGEGRISAQIISALPFLVITMVSIGNPRFYLDVMEDPIFWPTAAGAFAMMLLGIYIMYRMVNFRV
jgi:tight adherence protein B